MEEPEEEEEEGERCLKDIYSGKLDGEYHQWVGGLYRKRQHDIWDSLHGDAGRVRGRRERMLLEGERRRREKEEEEMNECCFTPNMKKKVEKVVVVEEEENEEENEEAPVPVCVPVLVSERSEPVELVTAEGDEEGETINLGEEEERQQQAATPHEEEADEDDAFKSLSERTPSPTSATQSPKVDEETKLEEEFENDITQSARDDKPLPRSPPPQDNPRSIDNSGIPTEAAAAPTTTPTPAAYPLAFFYGVSLRPVDSITTNTLPSPLRIAGYAYRLIIISLIIVVSLSVGSNTVTRVIESVLYIAVVLPAVVAVGVWVKNNEIKVSMTLLEVGKGRVGVGEVVGAVADGLVTCLIAVVHPAEDYVMRDVGVNGLLGFDPRAVGAIVAGVLAAVMVTWGNLSIFGVTTPDPFTYAIRPCSLIFTLQAGFIGLLHTDYTPAALIPLGILSTSIHAIQPPTPYHGIACTVSLLLVGFLNISTSKGVAATTVAFVCVVVLMVAVVCFRHNSVKEANVRLAWWLVSFFVVVGHTAVSAGQTTPGTVIIIASPVMGAIYTLVLFINKDPDASDSSSESSSTTASPPPAAPPPAPPAQQHPPEGAPQNPLSQIELAHASVPIPPAPAPPPKTPYAKQTGPLPLRQGPPLLPQDPLQPQLQGVSPQPQGVAPQPQGITPQPQGIALPQGVAPQPQGITPQPQGATALPGRPRQQRKKVRRPRLLPGAPMPVPLPPSKR